MEDDSGLGGFGSEIDFTNDRMVHDRVNIDCVQQCGKLWNERSGISERWSCLLTLKGQGIQVAGNDWKCQL